MLTIKALAFYLWTAATTWTPPQHQTAAWREPEATAAGRYLDFAADVARVALDPDESPLPLAAEDDEARARTGLLLVALASFESAMADAVIRCRIRGPGGAVGPYQTHRDQARACLGVGEATRVALDMLRESWRVCRRSPMPDRLALYTDGRCPTPWPRSRARYGRAVGWWGAHPLAWAEELREGWGDLD